MVKKYENVIVACCFLFIFVDIGLSSTSFNVYQPSIVALVGDAGGSLVLSTRTLTALIATLFVDRYYHLLDCRRGVALAALFTTCAFVIYSVAHSLPAFLAGAFMAGLGYGLGGMVGATLLVRRWYRTDVGRAVGIAAVGSGVASIIIPVIAVHVIERMSLAASFRMEAAIALVVAVLVFLLLRNRPADMGLQPHGAQDVEQSKGERRDSGQVGCRVSTLERRLVLASMVLLGMMCVGGVGYLSVMLSNEGFSSVFAASMLSVLGVALTLFKFATGELFDRLGTLRGSAIMFGVFTVGALLCCLAVLGSAPVSAVGAALYGAGAALGTVGVSVWSIEMADPKDYARSIKNFQLFYSAGGFLGTLFPGPLKELVGTYMVSYDILLVSCVACGLVVVGTYWRHRGDRSKA